MTAVALSSDRVPATTEAARLFEAYSEQLLGYCLGQLGSRPEAEDAIQTTFLYALRALRRGVIPECESAWLMTIARNVCHTHRRTLGRRGSLTADVELDRIALAQPDHDDEELLAGLRDALASLPDNQRRALVLREWHGVAPREIATQLGISGPATHALLTRARRSLAQALTLPQKPVLGLAWLVLELRSQIKALVGGMSAKAAVTTAAVAGMGVGVVGIGGVALERNLTESKAPPAPVEAADRSAVEPKASAPTLPAMLRSNAPPRVSATKVRAFRPGVVPALTDPASPSVVPTVAQPQADEPERDAEPAGNTSSPASELPLDPPVVQLQLPNVESPTQLLSPVVVPPLPTDLPPVPPLPIPTEDIAPAGILLP